MLFRIFLLRGRLKLAASFISNATMRGGGAGSRRRVFFGLDHSTSRITLRRFIRSRACTTSFLSSTARRRSTVRVASRGPGSMYSPRMRLASSTARMSVSWSGLFITATQLHRTGNQTGEGIFVPVGHCGFIRLRKFSYVIAGIHRGLSLSETQSG
jgi:hypothetical protein